MNKKYAYVSTDINETLEKYNIPAEAKDDVMESIQIGEMAVFDLTFNFM